MGVERHKGHDQHGRRAEEDAYQHVIQAFKIAVRPLEGAFAAADQKVSEDGVDACGAHLEDSPQPYRDHVVHAVYAQKARIARDDRAQNGARALLEHVGQLHGQRVPAGGEGGAVGLRVRVHVGIMLFGIARQKHRPHQNGQRGRQPHHDYVHAQVGQHHDQRGGQHQRAHRGQRNDIRALIGGDEHAVARHGEELQHARQAHRQDEHHHAQMAHGQAV